MFFPDNVVFMGGEFASGKVVSIGLIAPDVYTGSGKRLRPGSELYLEIAPEAGSSRLDEAAAMSATEPKVVTKPEAAAIISDFLGEEKPYLVTEANRLEWASFCNLFGLQPIPFKQKPIEFAEILMAAGIDPRIDRQALAEKFHVDTGRFEQNRSLDATRLLMALYYAMKEHARSR